MFLLNLPRHTKRLILFSVDLFLAPLCFMLAIMLRYGSTDPLGFLPHFWPVMVCIAIVAGVTIWLSGLPHINLNAIETTAITRIGLASIVLAVAAIVFSYLFSVNTPRSVPIIFGALYFLFTTGIRITALMIFGFLRERSLAGLPVAIYGAGSAGIQVAMAISKSSEMRPVFFVDDSHALQGLMVAGLQVKHPMVLERMAKTGAIRRVLVAIPSLDQAQRAQLGRRLSQLSCETQFLPSYVELIESGSLQDSLRPVAPDELLGRNKVDLAIDEVARTYVGRVVMVTGAGGSIGSELCRQLIDCKPAKIVLFENNEYALYQIDRELQRHLAGGKIEIIPKLGSVINPDRVRQVISEAGVEVILHAAAYKHVPLVEANEVEGAQNNVLGTRVVAEAAVALGVGHFILVSTDKAVRPTNVMGATKRLAELVVQDLHTRSAGTKLAMVRFGNVLGSSGSVLPLFQSQIASGGPVTVTHPDVTRFFMTIPEAARLVLLAGAFAKGGDVFVLDMGQPMRIADIARKMIELSGRTVRENGQNGDIEIIYTGLRPGEKLYEELLITGDSLRATPHQKIMRAEEAHLSEIEIQSMLRRLRAAISAGDAEGVRATVKDYVTGYHRQEGADLPRLRIEDKA